MFMSIWIPINGTSRTLWNAWHIAAHCSAAGRKWWPESGRLKGLVGSIALARTSLQNRIPRVLFHYLVFPQSPAAKRSVAGSVFYRRPGSPAFYLPPPPLFCGFLSSRHNRDTPVVHSTAYPTTEEHILQNTWLLDDNPVEFLVHRKCLRNRQRDASRSYLWRTCYKMLMNGDALNNFIFS